MALVPGLSGESEFSEQLARKITAQSVTNTPLSFITEKYVSCN